MVSIMEFQHVVLQLCIQYIQWGQTNLKICTFAGFTVFILRIACFIATYWFILNQSETGFSNLKYKHSYQHTTLGVLEGKVEKPNKIVEKPNKIERRALTDLTALTKYSNKWIAHYLLTCCLESHRQRRTGTRQTVLRQTQGELLTASIQYTSGNI